MKKPVWYDDYIRMTDDTTLIRRHFLRDFLFHPRLKFIFFFRHSQNTKSRLIRFYCNWRLYRFSRKYGVEIKPCTKIGAGFVMVHSYNITVSPYATLGKNVTMLKGATVGESKGKHSGAPTIGDSVYIGLNSTVLGGITVGCDVLIAPNTLVTQDVPDHSVVIGSPCRIIPRENAAAPYIHHPV